MLFLGTLFFLLFKLNTNRTLFVSLGGSRSSELVKLGFVSDLWDTKVESNQVGTRYYVIYGKLVISIERTGSGIAFRSRPEGLSVFVGMVLREESLEVTDGVVMVTIELIACDLHALLEVSGFLKIYKSLHVGESRDHFKRARFSHFSNKSSRVSNETSSVLRSIAEHTVELVTAPLDAMLNQVGEVPHSAHGNSIFWRILDLVIAQCLVRDNHLRVGFSAECSGLKKGLLVPDAPLIDVSTCVNVINSVNHEIKAFPELVIEHIFCVLTYASGVGFRVQGGVHYFSNLSSALRFLFADVVVSE